MAEPEVIAKQNLSVRPSSAESKKQKTPTITSAVSAYATKKATPVVSPEEIRRIVDLGLGRGLDITKRTPWLDKSSFQVRPVDLENIIGTEEGGSLQNYEREIVSVQDQRGELKASITLPQSPVSIGVDAEQARSHASTRRSVGKKVVNRTVSFRADFHDAPRSCTRDPREAKREAYISGKEISSLQLRADTPVEMILTQPRMPSLGPTSDSEGSLTFEERLCSWILERVIHRAELRAMQSAISKGEPPVELVPDVSVPVEALGRFIQECTHDERKEIVKDCKDFVYHFRITHYVCAIELGAAEYRVMSEEEYETRVGMGGSFGFEAIANAAVKETARWKKTKRASDLKRIGLIKPDGTVERGSYGEAVVGIQIQPLSSLVKIRYVQLALQQALLNYSSEEGNKSTGPFIIACNNDTVYLTVNQDQDYAVEGTINIDNASPFRIVPSDGSHPNEFMLMYYSEKTPGKFQQLRRGSSTLNAHLQQAVRPVPRYLNAEASVRGKNSGPLRMVDRVDESCARLVLQSRIKSSQSKTVVDPNPWVSGREVYFIRCARRRFRKEGYLCVKFKPYRQNGPPHKTRIVPSTDVHNEHNKFMLFRLLPLSLKQQLKSPDADTEEADSQQEERQGTGKEELEMLSLHYRRFSEWRCASTRRK